MISLKPHYTALQFFGLLNYATDCAMTAWQLLECYTYILLSKCKGRTGRITPRILDSTDRAQWGLYRKDRGPIFSQYSLEQARLKRDLLQDWERFLYIEEDSEKEWEWTKFCPNILKKKVRESFLCRQSLLFLFCKPLQHTNRARDHSGNYPVQYLENIELATEQSD